MDQGALFLLVFLGLFYCITSRRFFVLCSFYLHKFSTQTLYFFLGCQSSIESFHYSTKPFSCGNSLESGHTCSQYQNFRGRYTSCSSGKHRKISREKLSRLQHGCL